MLRKQLASLLLLVCLSVAACGKDSGSPSGPSGPGGSPEGPTPNNDPVDNGTWSPPADGAPTSGPVDTAGYTPAGSGSGGTSGASTELVFQTSGSARYNIGTCGPEGTWTDPLGNVYGPHNPNCLGYTSEGEVGNNGKGECVASTEGYPGLWLNPQAHATSPYHLQCLQLGSTTTTLALSFPGEAKLYIATDGSGGSVLNFISGDEVVAQLVYDGTLDGTTTGTGVLLGTDNAMPARTWSIDFAQPALSYSGGAANGDLITELQETGVQVVACSSPVGCSLVTLQLTLTP